jgi:dTMP kinase
VNQTWREIVDGLRFIRSNPMVRGVMIGLAGGLLGGGQIVPLGAVFAKEVLKTTPSAIGFLTTALGVGAALGVITLLAIQRRVPRQRVFTVAVLVCGVAIMSIACVSTLAFAIVLVGVVGAGAGVAYVTGFTLLQEAVTDEMRGRTFATLYTLVRVCLLLSLTIGPFIALGLGSLSDHLIDGALEIGSATISLQGARLALLAGGLLTLLSGIAARRRMRREFDAESQAA